MNYTLLPILLVIIGKNGYCLDMILIEFFGTHNNSNKHGGHQNCQSQHQRPCHLSFGMCMHPTQLGIKENHGYKKEQGNE
jgi:hypothetical protein